MRAVRAAVIGLSFFGTPKQRFHHGEFEEGLFHEAEENGLRWLRGWIAPLLLDSFLSLGNPVLIVTILRAEALVNGGHPSRSH